MSSKTTLVSHVLTPSVPLSDAEQREMGRQLTEQYRRTQLAELEIVTFGAMCLEVEAAISAEFGTDTRMGGKATKGKGLKGWLARFASEVGYSNARRYRDIADAIQGKLQLDNPQTLRLIAGIDVENLDKKTAAKRKKLVDLVCGHSVRGLQLELGLLDVERGGSRAKSAPAERAASSRRPPCPLSVGTKAMRDHFDSLSDDQAVAFVATWDIELLMSKAVAAGSPLHLHEADRDRAREIVTRFAAQLGLDLR